MTGPRSITDIDFAKLTNRTYTPSPACWSDQVLYFVMLDRFSDGNERDGYHDAQDRPVTSGATRLATVDDEGSVPYEQWLSQGDGWQGGTLNGLKSTAWSPSWLARTIEWLGS